VCSGENTGLQRVLSVFGTLSLVERVGLCIVSRKKKKPLLKSLFLSYNLDTKTLHVWRQINNINEHHSSVFV
jgi:hypothetical protein